MSTMKRKEEDTWNAFEHSWFSSVDFLAYLCVAVLFFNMGMTYQRVKA